MFSSLMETISSPFKKPVVTKKPIFNNRDGFKNHVAFCFLILQETRVFPLDVSRYIIITLLKGGQYFLNYEADFDKNGILYYLGTDGRSHYVHPQTRNMIRCTPEKIYSGNILQSFCHDVTSLFRDSGNSHIVQNWHYADDAALRDVLTKDLCMYIQFLKHSVIPIKYTMRHGYPGGHAMRSWNFEATNDPINDAIINKTWVVLDVRVEDPSISPTVLLNSASFDIMNPDGKSYHTFRIRLTGPNSSQSHYFMMAGFELYGTLFDY